MTPVGGFLEWFWRLSPGQVFVVVLLIDYGLVNLLMWWPEGRFLRKRYLAFLIGDSPIGLPLGFAGVAALVGDDLSVSGVSAIIAVGVGIGLVVVFWVLELVMGQYTLEEQLTPSKLAHTLVFGLLAMLIMPAIIPAVQALSLKHFFSLEQGTAAAVVGWGIWAATVLVDSLSGRKVSHAHKTKAMMAQLN